MADPRIIRPIKAGSERAAGAVELGFQDIQTVSRQMVREARESVREARERVRALQEDIERRECEARDRAEAFERGFERRGRELEEAQRVALDADRQRLLDETRRSGREEGYREGFEQGRAEGAEEGSRDGSETAAARVDREMASIVTALRAVLVEIEDRRVELIHGARGEVLALAVRIAGHVLRREVREIRDELVIENVRRALDLIFLRQRITVEVHPDDLAGLERHVEEAVGLFREVESCELRSSTEIDPGGCRVLSGSGSVDLSLETQLEVIEHALLGDLIDLAPEAAEGAATAAAKRQASKLGARARRIASPGSRKRHGERASQEESS